MFFEYVMFSFGVEGFVLDFVCNVIEGNFSSGFNKNLYSIV